MQVAAESSDILGNIQMGFRPKFSCADNLFLMDTVIEIMKKAKNKRYIMSLLDISKAYDRVPRVLLWEKLKGYGMPDPLLNVIKNAYKNPCSKIRFEQFIMEKKYIDLGLKQGCVMSPILFFFIFFFILS